MLFKRPAHPLSTHPGSSHLQQVFIVNPDPISCSITARTLNSTRIKCKELHSPGDLIKELPVSSPACFLLDVFLPDYNGLRLMEQLRNKNCFHPCIFMSTKIDPKIMVSVMNRGAFGFLSRPYQSLELIEMVQSALIHDQALSPYISIALEYKRLRSQLSQREQEILSRLELSKTAQAIAQELNLSRRTVENHRVRIFQKMNIMKGHQLIERATALNLLRAHGTIE